MLLLALVPLVALADVVFEDAFDDGVLPGDGDPQVWAFDTDGTTAPHWDAAELDGELVVTDIHVAPGTTEGWTGVMLTHDLDEALDDFDLVMEMSWDSVDDRSGVDEVTAIQDLFVILYDADGQRLAQAGLWDAWFSSQGKAFVEAALAEPEEYPLVPLAGGERVHIWRDGDEVTAEVGDLVSVSATSDRPLERIRLSFQFGPYGVEPDDSHFGTERVAFVRLRTGEVGDTGTVGDGGVADGGAADGGAGDGGVADGAADTGVTPGSDVTAACGCSRSIEKSRELAGLLLPAGLLLAMKRRRRG